MKQWMTTRRSLLIGSTAGLAVLASSRFARAEQRYLRLGYLYSKDSQLGAGAAAFAAEVEKLTHGKYRVDQYPNAELGGELEMIEGVQGGQIDIAFVSNAPFASVIPDMGILDIPFIFRSAEHAHSVLDGPIGQDLLAKFDAKDVAALAWGENGMRHLTNSKRPIKTPADLKGLKIRVPQSDVMVQGFKALGADAQALAFPAVYGALESGKFDGQENPIATIQAAKFDKVQKYLTLSGHVYGAAAFLMSKDTFGDLSSEDRAAFKQAAIAGGKASRVYAANAEKNGVAVLKQAGMEVVTDIDRAAFIAALKPAIAEFSKQFGADRIERIQAVKTAQAQ